MKDQFASRPSGSTTGALTYCLHHVTLLLETNSYVRVLLVDFSKAFDVVNHALLIPKLLSIELTDNIHNWIRPISFLSGRTQFSKIGDTFSTYTAITRSIIPGSGFGLTAYVIMEGDLHPISEINRPFKFADDVNLIVPEKTDCCLLEEFDHIKKLARANYNKMIINLCKAKETVLKNSNPRLYLSPHKLDAIEQVLEAKLFGVVFDHRLNFDTHLHFVLTLCSQRVYLLTLLRDHGLSHINLDIILQAIMISRISYAISARGGFFVFC